MGWWVKCQNSEHVSCHAEFLMSFYTWKCPQDEWRRTSQRSLSLLSVVQGHTLGCPLLGLGRKLTIPFLPSPHYHSNVQTLIRKLLINISSHCQLFHENHDMSQIAKLMGPTWGPPGSCRPQMGPMLAPWTLLSGVLPHFISHSRLVYAILALYQFSEHTTTESINTRPCYLNEVDGSACPTRSDKVHYPDSMVHGANMGPIWGRQDPGGPYVGPVNFSIWVGSEYMLIKLWFKAWNRE